MTDNYPDKTTSACEHLNSEALGSFESTPAHSLIRIGDHNIFNLTSIQRVQFFKATDHREAELRVWSGAHRIREHTAVYGHEAEELWRGFLELVE